MLAAARARPARPPLLEVLMKIVLFFPCILIRVNGSLTPGEAGLRLWVPWKLKFRSCGNQTNQRSVEVDTDLEGQKEGKAEALQIASRAFFHHILIFPAPHCQIRISGLAMADSSQVQGGRVLPRCLRLEAVTPARRPKTRAFRTEVLPRYEPKYIPTTSPLAYRPGMTSPSEFITWA